MFEKSKIYTLHLMRFIALLLLTIYITLTVIYVSPANPLRDTMAPFLNATIGAYFPQDWNLFAPVPRTADLALLVRPLNRDDLKTIQTQGLPDDGWYNLSAPLWTKFQSNRFSAYNKLGRPADQAIVQYIDQSQQQNQPQQQSVEIMVKVASAFCKDIGQNQTSFVALMIYEKQSKPWTERGTAKPRVVNTIFVGIYPIDKSVEKMNLYQIGGKNEHIP